MKKVEIRQTRAGYAIYIQGQFKHLFPTREEVLSYLRGFL